MLCSVQTDVCTLLCDNTWEQHMNSKILLMLRFCIWVIDDKMVRWCHNYSSLLPSLLYFPIVNWGRHRGCSWRFLYLLKSIVNTDYFSKPALDLCIYFTFQPSISIQQYDQLEDYFNFPDFKTVVFRGPLSLRGNAGEVLIDSSLHFPVVIKYLRQNLMQRAVIHCRKNTVRNSALWTQEGKGTAVAPVWNRDGCSCSNVMVNTCSLFYYKVNGMTSSVVCGLAFETSSFALRIEGTMFRWDGVAGVDARWDTTI